MAAKRKAAAPKIHVPESELKLDLGSGQRPREGYQSVDRSWEKADWRVDLWAGQEWPWANESVDAFHASHVIEHIELGNRHVTYTGQGNLFFFFFEEAWRCAKPGAKFTLIWPVLKSVRAFMDPTHCRFVPREALLYLDRNWRESQGLDHYLGHCDWVTESAMSTTLIERTKLPDRVQQEKTRAEWDFHFDEHATLVARKA